MVGTSRVNNLKIFKTMPSIVVRLHLQTTKYQLFSHKGFFMYYKVEGNAMNSDAMKLKYQLNLANERSERSSLIIGSSCKTT